MVKSPSLLMTIKCISSIEPILRKYFGFFWFFLVAQSFLQGEKLFKKTRWSKRKDDEAKYVKTMAVLPAFYLIFKKKFGEKKALIIMSDVIVRASYVVDYKMSKKNYLFSIKDPFERWIKYRSLLITDGFGLYSDIEDVYISRDRMHYVVKRCIFHDFFLETNTPELTPLICNYDKLYHSTIFNEFYFDRNGSWENTIGYGASVCQYVWKSRNSLTEDFMDFIDNSAFMERRGEERRKNPRRQFDRRQTDRRQFDRRQQ